jgi:hypothetical protein
MYVYTPEMRAFFTREWKIVCSGEGNLLVARKPKYSIKDSNYYFFETDAQRDDFIAAHPEWDLRKSGPYPPHRYHVKIDGVWVERVS